MLKCIKFQNYDHAAEMMGFAIQDGHATAWNVNDNGLVRYLCAKTGFWLDLTKGTFAAWQYAY